MVLDYPQKKSGLFILKKADFDDIASSYLQENMPKVLERIAAVDIQHIAEEVCYLNVQTRKITKDGFVLGLLAYGDVTLTLYNRDNKREVVELSEGTVLIDESLSHKDQSARYRFTLAHEVSHWLLHRTRYNPTKRQYALRYFACRTQDIELDDRTFVTDNDWEEWQADKLAASLLMPRKTFEEATHKAMQRYSIDKERLYKRVHREQEKRLKTELSKGFHVSNKAVEIRLKDLSYIDANTVPTVKGIDVFP